MPNGAKKLSFPDLDSLPLNVAAGVLVYAAMAAATFAPSMPTKVMLGMVLVVGAILPGAGLIASAVALFTMPLIALGGPVSDIRADELLAVAIVLGVALRCLAGRRLPRTELTVPFAAFIATALISIVVMNIVAGAPLPPKAYLFPLAKHVIRLGLFLSAFWVVRRASGIDGPIRVALLAGANLGGALAVAQSLSVTAAQFVITWYPSIRGGEAREFWESRAFAAFDGNPNHLGAAMMLAVFMALAAADSSGSRRARFGWFAASVVPTFALIASGSRADFIIFAAVIVPLVVRRRWAYVWSAVVAGLYAVFVPNAFSARIFRLFDFEMGMLGRSAAGKVTMAAGDTYIQDSRLIMTDNFYLDVLYNFGFIALAAFLWLAWRVLRRLWTERHVEGRQRSFVGGSLLVWVSYLLLALQASYFGASRLSELLWIVTGVTWGVMALQRERDSGPGGDTSDEARHVVMLLSNDAVSDPRVEKEARALAEDGWRVTVLAWDRSGTLPRHEHADGFRIERVGPPARHGGGVRNITAFQVFWEDAAERAFELAPDVIHCHDLDTAMAGKSARRRLRLAGGTARLVIDFHENYRESNMIPQRGAAGRAARAAVRAIERLVIPAADVALVANPSTHGYYHGLGAKQVVGVENAPELALFEPVPERGASDPLRVCFIGQKRYVPGLATLIEAVDGEAGMTALLAGGGVGEAKVAELAADSGNVETVGRVAYADIPALYRDCGAVLATYDSSVANWRANFPVKAMEGMASALPVIVSDATWVADYVRENGIGLVVDPEDPESLRAALVTLRDDPMLAAEMGRRGRAIIESELNWQAVAERLRATYRALASA